MFPEETCIAIHLVVPFIIDIFERVQTEIALFFFKSEGISLKICLITPHHISVVFYLIQTITLNIIRSMHMTYEDYVPLFPTIIALKNTRIYVCFSNHHNVAFYVKTSVDKAFSLITAYYCFENPIC